MTTQNIPALRKHTLDALLSIIPKDHPPSLNTSKLAEFLGVKDHTIRRAICVEGHYLGLVPMKLPNGRLLFKIAD